MKTNLQAKLIQHFANKKGNKGFTLIELLVVVIIIGILAAVALPSMLNQAGRARQAAAESQAGAINRAQQAYRLENAEFAPGTDELQIGDQAPPDQYAQVVITANTGASATAFLDSANADQSDICGNVTVDATTGATEAEIIEGACP